jgi:hypothetical protein
MNRRHKVILFITLVLTGSALLTGVEIKAALGTMMLGIALAWAVGSEVASRSYSELKAITDTFYLWIKLPLAMMFAGFVLGAALLFSQANPVVVMAVASVAGIVIEPFTSLPTQKLWLRVPLWLVASAAFVLAYVAILLLDKPFLDQNAEKLGDLTITSFFALLAGVWWLSKGWRLIVKGITTEGAAPPPLPGEPPRKRAVGQYISLLLGIVVLTLWLGLLTWLASGNWVYAPPETASSKSNNNPLTQFGTILLLAWWPYAAWRNILTREPNSEPRYLRRHKRIATAAGMSFIVVLSLAVTFGIQNGHDRDLTDQITKSGQKLAEVATTIGDPKRRDLKSADDYVQAYSEISRLQPDFDAKIQEFAASYRASIQQDESRGPINIQRLYKNHTTEARQNTMDMIELLRQVSELTKQETEVVTSMAALPGQDQVRFWEANFRPFVEQERALGEKMIAVQAKLQPAQ